MNETSRSMYKKLVWGQFQFWGYSGSDIKPYVRYENSIYTENALVSISKNSFSRSCEIMRGHPSSEVSKRQILISAWSEQMMQDHAHDLRFLKKISSKSPEVTGGQKLRRNINIFSIINFKIALGFRNSASFRSFSEFHKISVGVYFENYECQFCVDKRRLLRQIWLKLRPWEIAWQLEISEFRQNEVTDAKNVQEMLTFHFLAHFEMTKIARCEFT